MTISEFWARYGDTFDEKLSDREWLGLDNPDTKERLLKHILYDAWQTIKNCEAVKK